MTLDRLGDALGALLLVLWVIGVAGRLGTGLAVNWALFLAGVALIALAPVPARLRRRSSGPEPDRP